MSSSSNSNSRKRNHNGGAGGDPASKKPRMEWTPELHQKFLQVVNKIGLESGPKEILKMMGVPGLTRAHVASHLQKYRLRFGAKSPMEQNHSDQTLTDQGAIVTQPNENYVYGTTLPTVVQPEATPADYARLSRFLESDEPDNVTALPTVAQPEDNAIDSFKPPTAEDYARLSRFLESDEPDNVTALPTVAQPEDNAIDSFKPPTAEDYALLSRFLESDEPNNVTALPTVAKQEDNAIDSFKPPTAEDYALLSRFLESDEPDNVTALPTVAKQEDNAIDSFKPPTAEDYALLSRFLESDEPDNVTALPTVAKQEDNAIDSFKPPTAEDYALLSRFLESDEPDNCTALPTVAQPEENAKDSSGLTYEDYALQSRLLESKAGNVRGQDGQFDHLAFSSCSTVEDSVPSSYSLPSVPPYCDEGPHHSNCQTLYDQRAQFCELMQPNFIPCESQGGQFNHLPFPACSCSTFQGSISFCHRLSSVYPSYCSNVFSNEGPSPLYDHRSVGATLPMAVQPENGGSSLNMTYDCCPSWNPYAVPTQFQQGFKPDYVKEWDSYMSFPSCSTFENTVSSSYSLHNPSPSYGSNALFYNGAPCQMTNSMVGFEKLAMMNRIKPSAAAQSLGSKTSQQS